jgi:hypothetical protein
VWDFLPASPPVTLGSKAGRERYEQIRRWIDDAAEPPG